MILVELSLSVWHRHSWAQLGMWPTLAISQSGDNQQKQLVLIGLILQTPSADNSAKYSRNQKSARDPEWQGEYSAIHAGQNINKIKCLLLLSFEYLDKIISFRAWQYCIPWFILCNQSWMVSDCLRWSHPRLGYQGGEGWNVSTTRYRIKGPP